jgi:hypothetical protein
VPGDKSISHRSLILGALSVGETRITGLLEGQDVLDTARAMRAFGAEVTQHGAGVWSVHGVGVGGFGEPEDVIDCGNSGTGRAPDHGRDGDDADQRDLHRRREPAQPPDGARDRSACAVRDESRGPRGRTAADDDRGRGRSAAGALHAAGAFGAGEIGGAAGGSEPPARRS